MGWTYSGNPNNSAKDAVRFLIGDTIQTDPILQDGEIEYFLGIYNNTPLNAAIRCCETIIALFSRQVDEGVGKVKISFSQKVKQYTSTLAMLKVRLATEDAQPFSGALTHTEKNVNDSNNNLVKPDFTKHMMEDHQGAPWTSNDTTGPRGGNG